MKTSELTGPALDWAVAKCEGIDSEAARLFHDEGYYNYSTNWSQGGPIIERNGLSVWGVYDAENFESKCVSVSGWESGRYEGPTPLIAAMRCFVASKLGDEVDVPDELT